MTDHRRIRDRAKAQVIIPHGFRLLSENTRIRNGDYILATSPDHTAVNLHWQKTKNVNFPWYVNHGDIVIRKEWI